MLETTYQKISPCSLGGGGGGGEIVNILIIYGGILKKYLSLQNIIHEKNLSETKGIRKIDSYYLQIWSTSLAFYVPT